jgi:L-fucose isomerase
MANLRGSVYGLFGGRSLGIDTGSIDPMQWRKMFGVDVEHIGQLEIIRLADQMEDAEAQKTVDWLTENVRAIEYNKNVLTPQKLAYQVKCYLATKRIIEEKGLDFVSVKCMPDLSTHYVPQCLSAALLPGPYDAEGEKSPVSMSCEADSDGALTMEILKQVSGGKPTLFSDVSYLNEGTCTMYIPNCGAMSTWFAARSEDAAENLGRVTLRPAIRPGGGAVTYFTAAAGPITLARLYRKSGQYQMAIIPGEAVELSEEELQAFVDARGPHQLPTAFVKVKIDFDALLGTYASNHISGVAGDYVEELIHFCQLMGIECRMFNDREGC